MLTPTTTTTTTIFINKGKSKPAAVGSDIPSYISLCIQHDDQGIDEDDHDTNNNDPLLIKDKRCLHWWNLSHGFMEFLRATHTSTSPASKIRDLTEMKRYIFSFLKDPKIVIGVSFCTYRMCSGTTRNLVGNKQPCTQSVCERHGWSEQSVDESFRCNANNEYTNCQRVYCWKHNDPFENNDSLFYCDVCENTIYAERSLGCHDWIGHLIFCPDHKPIQCTKIIRCDYYDADDDDEDDDEVEEAVEICGFYCCPSCLEDHKCGDDPHGYL